MPHDSIGASQFNQDGSYRWTCEGMTSLRPDLLSSFGPEKNR